MQPARIATVQFEPAPGDVAENFGRMEEYLAILSDDVEMAVFPELCVTGYDLQVAEREAEPVPGPHTDRLTELADEYGVHVLAGLPELAGSNVYNDLVYVTESGLEGRYRKQRLWGDESDTFLEGNGPEIVETSFGSIGLLVCYDLNFPEIFLSYGHEAVEVLVVSSAWRTDFLEDWELLLRARALDATSYIVGSNQVGDQRGRDHAGHSMIVGPDGTTIASMDADPGVVSATVSPDDLERARQRNPVLSYRVG